MACDIASDIGHESFTALCVLKGGYQFFSDLLDMIRQVYRFSTLYAVQATPATLPAPFHIRAEFIRVKSYENDSSTGNVRITGIEDLESLKGQVNSFILTNPLFIVTVFHQNVLVVEDIIDSGQTMVKLLEALRNYSPKSLRVSSLFWKRNPHATGYVPNCKFWRFKRNAPPVA
jgi:hypoxanthine phosphoribosyltransferase